MAPSPVSSLRSRFLLLVLLAVLPAFGLIAYTAAGQRRLQAAEGQAEALRLARITSANQARFIEGARQLLVALAQLPVVRGGDPTACSAFLADLLKQYPLYANFGLIELNGDLSCSAILPRTPVNAADRAYFLRAVERRDFAIGEYQVGRATGKATINFGYPIFDKANRVRAVVFAALDLSWLNRFAAEAALPQGSTLTVMDRTGRIFVNHPDADQWVGRAVPDSPLVKAIQTRDEGVAQVPGVDGISRLYAFSRLSGAEPGVYVTVGISSKEAFAEANRAFARNLAGLGMVAALALAAAWLGSDLFLLRRLRALVNVAKRLGSGDLSARTGMPGGHGELSQLAEAFDEMAAALQMRQAEARQAEEALGIALEKRKELEAIVNNSPAIVFLWRAAEGWPVEFVSDNIRQFGYSPEDFTSGRIPYAKLIHGEDLERVGDEVSRYSQAGPTEFTQEYRIVTKSGEVRWVDDRTWVRRDASGVTTHYQGIVIDITARKRAEEALWESEQRFRLMADTAPVMLWVSGPDARCTFFSKPWLDFRGRTLEQEAGYGWAEGVHPDDLQRCLDTYGLAFKARRRFTMEYRMRRADGEHRWMLDNAAPRFTPDGSFAGYVGSCIDITGRKQAEEALKESEDRYRDLVENSEDLICTHDLEGRFLSVNRALVRRLGYERAEEFLGRTLSDLLAPDVRHLFGPYLDTVVREGHAYGFMKVLTRSGEKRILEYHNSLRTEGLEKPIVRGMAHDVTERTRAEAALRKSEATNRALLSANPDLMFRIGKDGTYLSFKAERETDLLVPPSEFLGKKVGDVLPEELAQQTMRHVERALQTGETQTYDYRLVVNGALRDYEARVVRSGEDEVLTIVREITERKRAEAALRENEDRYRDLVENSGVLIGTHDLDGTILSVNRAVVRLSGCEPAEKILGTKIGDFLAPDARHLFDGYLDTVVKQGHAHGLMKILTRSGEEKILEYNNSLRTEGLDRPVVRCIGHDVTERKRAEAALRASEERYRDLFENANDIIYTHDLAGHFTSLNKAGEQITGYTREEALGMNITDVVAPEHVELARQMISRKVDEGGPTTYELEIAAKGGRRLALEVSTRLIWQEGKPVAVQGIARDVTERKRLEEELRQAQKLEAIGQLAGGVAHDFNNLLNGIIGFTDLALQELPDGSKGHRYLSRVSALGGRAADLIGQLLAFARKAQLERKPLDLNSLFEETGKMLERTLPETLTIRVHSCPERLMVKAEHAQVQQILLNLATNARDAMHHRGILTLSLAPVALTEGSAGGHPERRPGDFARLTVADTGTGIPPAIRDRIFDPFFTTKEPGKGTGLGLASVYGIVHQHDGWIEVETVEHQGTAFHVFLPLLPSQEASIVPLAQAIPRGAETLLLVEDDATVRELGEILLAELGYTVLTAADGIEALTAYRAHPDIALVLTDAVMPRMGAADLIPALRSLNSEVKVLVATGYAPDQIRASLDHLGLSGYIGKPFRQGDLAAAVRAALDGPRPRSH